MIEKTTYISNDGKEFENKMDCLEYEQRFDLLKDENFVVFYNDDFSRNINFDADSEGNVFEKADYIILKNDKKEFINILEEAFSDAGFLFPCKSIGLYYFCDDYWAFFDEEYKKLSLIKDKLKYSI